MQGLINNMQNSLDMAGGSAGFTALFLTGLLALWYSKYDKKQELGMLFWYALISLLIAISPVYTGVVRKFLPELYEDNIYLWIIPTIPVIMCAAGRASLGLKTVKNRIIFGIVFVSILMLAAMTSYTLTKVNIADSQYIESDKKDIIEYICESIERHNSDSCLIWGEDAVMEHARLTDGRIRLLYGKDLWQSSVSVSENDIYPEDMIAAYQVMQKAPLFQNEVSKIAEENKCDFIIIAESSFEEAGVSIPEEMGSYFLEYSDNVYLLYTYSHYSRPEETGEDE